LWARRFEEEAPKRSGFGPRAIWSSGELLALAWADVDFVGRVLRISKSLEQTKQGLRVKPTKNEKPREIALPKSAIEVLRQHRSKQSENRRLFGPD